MTCGSIWLMKCAGSNVPDRMLACAVDRVLPRQAHLLHLQVISPSPTPHPQCLFDCLLKPPPPPPTETLSENPPLLPSQCLWDHPLNASSTTAADSRVLRELSCGCGAKLWRCFGPDLSSAPLRAPALIVDTTYTHLMDSCFLYLMNSCCLYLTIFFCCPYPTDSCFLFIRAQKEVRGSKFRTIWGKVTSAHGSSYSPSPSRTYAILSHTHTHTPPSHPPKRPSPRNDRSRFLVPPLPPTYMFAPFIKTTPPPRTLQ